MGAAQSLPNAVSGERQDLSSRAGRVAYYRAAPAIVAEPRPLLLIHSVNAAASAYEVRPLYEHFRASRPVYALELPGFGFSDRSRRFYSPRMMTDAIHAMMGEISRREGDVTPDALALSLSSEFLARAAVEAPGAFRSIALVSPTGVGGAELREGPEGSTRAMPRLHAAFTFPLWSRAFFAVLTSRVSIRYFLRKTWGSPDIDEGMAEYAYRTAHQPDARHAPYRFVTGFLFSNDIWSVYRAVTPAVWASHGIRGDFTDYRHLPKLKAERGWRCTEYATGALPHFETSAAFVTDYQAFLESVGAEPARGGSGA